MVGFDPSSTSLPSSWYVGAGALSGTITRACVQPLDVIKIRFQLQEEPLMRNVSSKYHSMFQAMRTIVTEEGIIALWKGHNPAQVLSILYGLVQFGSFEIITKEVWVHLPSYLTVEIRPATHFVCGGLSGCAATLACQPFDVIRTRFIAQGSPKVYNSMAQAASSIIKNDGYRGLYRGLIPTLIQIVPQSGFQFGFYSMFKFLWDGISQTTEENKSIGKTLTCGALAGLCAKTAVYPLDLAKKRLQVQGFAEARKQFGQTSSYQGLYDCFRQIVHREGAVGLYKGLGPSLVKAMLSVGLNFCAYEQLLNIGRMLYVNSET